MTASYAYWAQRLQRFADGDDGVLEELADATPAWEPGVAERLASRVAQAFQQRLEEIHRRLQRDLQNPRADLGHLGQALSRAKRSLDPLRRLAALRSLPDDLRGFIDGELRRNIAELQESLERSVRPDTAIGVEMLALLRRHALTGALEQPALASSAGDPPAAGRRLIL